LSTSSSAEAGNAMIAANGSAMTAVRIIDFIVLCLPSTIVGRGSRPSLIRTLTGRGTAREGLRLGAFAAAARSGDQDPAAMSAKSFL
jgi:hypothetical protein